MSRALLLLALVACGCEKKKKTPPSPEVRGTLSLDGKPLTIAKCRAGRGVTTYVELETAEGKLRFEDKQLFWASPGSAGAHSDADASRGLDDARLECTKLDRSWGGGLRKDGTSYFRGHLIFACRAPTGQPITGDVQVDCGGITDEERRELDRNRDEMRKQQQQQPGSGSG